MAKLERAISKCQLCVNINSVVQYPASPIKGHQRRNKLNKPFFPPPSQPPPQSLIITMTMADELYAYDRFGSKGGDSTENNEDDMRGAPPPQTSRPLSSEQLSLLRSLPCNDKCLECNAASNPDWVR